MEMNKKIEQALLGVFVGDALGVPVEFEPRSELDRNPVHDMREYGTYNQPKGTWSDDGSLTLATIHAYSQDDNLFQLMDRFVNWYKNSKYTATNKVFDIGNQTRKALDNYIKTHELTEFGESDPNSNGNGALMRMMPVALNCAYETNNDIIEFSSYVSALTHGHVISKACCAWYCVAAANIFKGMNKQDAFDTATVLVKTRYPETSEPMRKIYNNEIQNLSRNEISSDGYVVHSLEAAIWCLHNESTYKSAVLEAVNLGSDTDTTAAITGGLAGLLYQDIPQEWIDQLQKKEMILDIIRKFERKFDTYKGPAKR